MTPDVVEIDDLNENQIGSSGPTNSEYGGGEVASLESPDPIRLYLRDMSRTPLLSPEEEEALARVMAVGQQALEKLGADGQFPEEERDVLLSQARQGMLARDHLIRANTRLVIQIAKRYRGWGIAFSDLIQEGNLGLMRAADKFDYQDRKSVV